MHFHSCRPGGYGTRPLEDDSVARAVACPDELARTADAGDREEGFAATAEPDTLGEDSESEPSDDDADEHYWLGSSDNWASIYATALCLASPITKR